MHQLGSESSTPEVGMEGEPDLSAVRTLVHCETRGTHQPVTLGNREHVDGTLRGFGICYGSLNQCGALLGRARGEGKVPDRFRVAVNLDQILDIGAAQLAEAESVADQINREHSERLLAGRNRG